jgi:uncharacterized protein (TIGR02145 family)
VYTVSFNSLGGGAVPDQQIASGDLASLPGQPTKPKSYFFNSWCTTINCNTPFNFNTPITDHTTLYAKWDIKDIQGNVYDTLNFGGQVWMKQNFKCTKYTTGNDIPLAVKGYPDAGYRWYGDDPNNGNIYGALYNWNAVTNTNFAPDGWHVPSDAEWQTLQIFLIANGYNYDRTPTDNKIGQSLAAKTNWIIPEYPQIGTPGYDLSQNNRSNFSALPGGFMDGKSGFKGIGTDCGWWTSTQFDGKEAFDYGLANYHVALSMGNGGGFIFVCYSVRLVRD